MSESKLKHLEDEEYSSMIVEHSLTAGPWQLTNRFWEELFPLFYGHSDSIFSAISMNAAYNNF